LWYNLPLWYARSKGIKRQINSIHRRGGKDVNDFAMTVQDAVEYGGVHYYLFPTRVWAEDAIFKEQFEVNGVVKPFWEWAIPKGVKAQKRDKDCCILFPHNGARIQLGGTDDLSFVGRGGKSYTMSEFSLHKENVTGFIAPILRQSDAGFRANGTLRGKNNQLYRMLMANMNSPEWHVQWLRPEDTKCYCWVSDEYSINPELLPLIGEKSPNGGKIFNVQDDIDSGMISMALARQEYLNLAESQVEGSYYAHEMNIARGEGRIAEIEARSDRVYTFWDLGGASDKSDETVIVFAVKHEDTWQIIDYYANTGRLLEHYRDVLNSRGYNYAGHYVPHDAKQKKLFGDFITKAEEIGIKVKRVPKSNDVLSDLEICRRMWRNIEIHEPTCREFIGQLEEYHEKNGRPVHDEASHYADAFRTMCMAEHLNLVHDYLSPLKVKFNLPTSVGKAEAYVEEANDDTANALPLWAREI
jgi:hypothetical protein